jgi:hypothetical protein
LQENTFRLREILKTIILLVMPVRNEFPTFRAIPEASLGHPVGITI